MRDEVRKLGGLFATRLEGEWSGSGLDLALPFRLLSHCR